MSEPDCLTTGETNASVGQKRFFVSGKPFELWDNLEHPFGWSSVDMQHYAMRGDWELLFNALVMAASTSNIE